MSNRFSLRVILMVVCLVNCAFVAIAFHLRLQDARTGVAAPIRATGGIVKHAWFSERIELACFAWTQRTDSELKNAIVALANQPFVHAVAFCDTRITDQSMAALAQVQGIRKLYLDYTDVTDAGIYAIRHFSDLEVLHVPYTSVTARGIAYLGAHGKLRSLDMNGTMTQDDDLKHLRVFAQSLTVLNLSATPISSKGLRHLVFLSHLRELDISGTCVDQDAVSIIAKMPAIRVLHIHAVSINQNAIDELKKRRPDIRIFHEARKIQPCRPVPHLEGGRPICEGSNKCILGMRGRLIKDDS